MGLNPNYTHQHKDGCYDNERKAYPIESSYEITRGGSEGRQCSLRVIGEEDGDSGTTIEGKRKPEDRSPARCSPFGQEMS